MRRGLVAVLGAGGTRVVAPEQILDPATFLPAPSRTGCRVSVVGP